MITLKEWYWEKFYNPYLFEFFYGMWPLKGYDFKVRLVFIAGKNLLYCYNGPKGVYAVLGKINKRDLDRTYRKWHESGSTLDDYIEYLSKAGMLE